MKNIFYFLIFLVLIVCRKEGIDVKFKTIYTSSLNKSGHLPKSQSLLASTQGNYSQFGEFIGTITPKKVTVKFMTIPINDRKDASGGILLM